MKIALPAGFRVLPLAITHGLHKRIVFLHLPVNQNANAPGSFFNYKLILRFLFSSLRLVMIGLFLYSNSLFILLLIGAVTPCLKFFRHMRARLLKLLAADLVVLHDLGRLVIHGFKHCLHFLERQRPD